MTTKEYTKQILAEGQLYRDNDRELLIRVLKDSHVIENEQQAQAFRAMPFDLWDIRRNRQKIQEDGEYMPSEEIQRLRGKREVKERSKYSKRSVSIQPATKGYWDYSTGNARWISL